MIKKYSYITNSLQGTRRDKNQDRIMVVEDTPYAIFILFDGVSSLPFSAEFIEHYKRIFQDKSSKLADDGGNFDQLLYESHQEILKSQLQGKSTISALLLNFSAKSAEYLNIGDSRIYSVSNRSINKLTEDDSLYDGSSAVTRCLGMPELTEEDFKKRNVPFENRYLICSDGFYAFLESSKKAYFEVLNFKYFRNIEKKFVRLQRGKNKDDSTYILIENEV